VRPVLFSMLPSDDSRHNCCLSLGKVRSDEGSGMRSANGTAAKRARAGKPRSRLLTEAELRLREEKRALTSALHGKTTSSNQQAPSPLPEGQITKVESADESAKRDRLQRVNGALARMRKGAYGLCVRCGTSIQLRDLAFDPARPVCSGCETRGDGQGEEALV
jgi:RNA polymerase-binding transcription factor DksA